MPRSLYFDYVELSLRVGFDNGESICLVVRGMVFISPYWPMEALTPFVHPSYPPPGDASSRESGYPGDI
ncbi:unnamed protein product, partial [Brenthis ino]